MKDKEFLSLAKNQKLDPLVGLLYAQMIEVRKELIKSVEYLSINEIDFTPNEKTIESIGTLLLHIAAVEWSWIFEDINGLEMNFEKWKHAFPLRKNVNISQIKNKDISYYLEKLNTVRADVTKFILTLNDNDLNKEITDEYSRFTIEWIIYHLIEHEILHLGQIKLLIRLQKQKKNQIS